MSSHVLLRNAIILMPSGQPNDHVKPLRGHSLLITDNRISQIAPDIEPPAKAEVIDCTDKIVSPGFIDTHHHLWQTQLKGRHADQTLVEYMPNGNNHHVNYTPEDVFWGVLGGCLEALDAGTTTVVDHAHMTSSPAHASNGVEATVASGIRSVFCYTPAMRVDRWQPEMTLTGELLDGWVVDHFRKLGAVAPFGKGRVQLGLGFDGLFLPKDQVTSLYNEARQMGVRVITSHYVRGIFNNDSLVDTLDKYELLGPDILLSHATNLTVSDIEKLNQAKAWISTTPDTEMQMGHGNIVCFKDGCSDISSLGIDCQSNNSADMVSQMRLALQHERARRNEALVQAEGKWPRSLNLSVQKVFRLGTIQGARAIQMQNDLGSIEVGKLADLVVFDSTTPAMICAADEDPIAAIILHSSVRDIDTIIIDGHIRKRDGRLRPVDIDPSLPEVTIPPQTIEWSAIARQLGLSRRRIEDAMVKSNATDRERLVDAFMKLAHLDDDKFTRL